MITQLQLGGWGGRRYGSFGRDVVVESDILPRNIWELSLWINQGEILRLTSTVKLALYLSIAPHLYILFLLMN